MLDIASLVRKKADLRFNGADLRLELSHALFSSYTIDQGTRLLLKAVARDPALAAARRVLDEGCGVGVIGLAVAKAFPGVEVLMRDRDSLALAFAERNARLNRMGGRALRAEWGLLADGREGSGYDFVLSNLPAKAGGSVLAAFFAGMERLLAPEGRLGAVIVRPLAEAAAGWLAEAGLELVSVEEGKGHWAFVARRRAAAPSAAAPVLAAPAAEAPVAATPGTAALDPGSLSLGPYRRGLASFKMGSQSYRAEGFWGLPDFDTVGYAQVLAAELAILACPGSLVREALVVEPGVGHLALWIARNLGPVRLSAASRDLLALAATGANLSALPAAARPEYRPLDFLRLDQEAAHSCDLAVEFPDPVPEYDWISPFWERAGTLLKTGATLVAVTQATELTRLEKRRPQGWRLLFQKRKKGFAGAAYRLA